MKEFQSTKCDHQFDPQDPAEEAECWHTHLLKWTEAHRGSEEEMDHQETSLSFPVICGWRSGGATVSSGGKIFAQDVPPEIDRVGSPWDLPPSGSPHNAYSIVLNTQLARPLKFWRKEGWHNK